MLPIGSYDDIKCCGSYLRPLKIGKIDKNWNIEAFRIYDKGSTIKDVEGSDLENSGYFFLNPKKSYILK